MKNSASDALYTVQNELIMICGDKFRTKSLLKSGKLNIFSLLQMLLLMWQMMSSCRFAYVMLKKVCHRKSSLLFMMCARCYG